MIELRASNKMSTRSCHQQKAVIPAKLVPAGSKRGAGIQKSLSINSLWIPGQARNDKFILLEALNQSQFCYL